MKKILFILPSLHGGGAERVTVTLLKHLDRSKFLPHLALLNKEGIYLKEVPKDIVIHDLGGIRVRQASIPILKLIRKLKPQMVFSTLSHLNLAILSMKKLLPSNCKVIVREANTVSELIKSTSKPQLWKILYKNLYKRADLIICQSDFMKKDLVDNFGVPNDITVRIYNPVDVDLIKKRGESGENPFKDKNTTANIVAIGRLSQQKGFERLLKSVPSLLKVKPNAKVWILGEGQLENQLRNQCKELGISNYVEFVGFQENPYAWLKNADLFVLSSYFEGLPNVLLEALVCDSPVLALEHPGGTKEIMEKLGILDRLVQDEIVFKSQYFEPLEEEVQNRLRSLLGVEGIINEYEIILDKF